MHKSKVWDPKHSCYTYFYFNIYKISLSTFFFKDPNYDKCLVRNSTNQRSKDNRKYLDYSNDEVLESFRIRILKLPHMFIKRALISSYKEYLS